MTETLTTWKAVRKGALAALVILAILLGRGLIIRAPKTPPSLVPRPDASLRVCTRVLDGDTIVCEGVGKIRFIGIDAPELGSPGGEPAAQFLQDKIEGKRVRIEVCPVKPRDVYGRTRAIIYLPTSTGEENVNQLMVASGYARVSNFQPCHVDADQWLPLQDEAKRLKRGLWALAPSAFSPRVHGHRQ